MKNVFYFTLKAPFVPKIFKFLIRLISKFITSQPGKQTRAINILPDILRSKGKQTMKFGQLIEYNMRNIFLEKSYTKCGGETILRPFSEKPKLSISLHQRPERFCSFLKFFIFIVCPGQAYEIY